MDRELETVRDRAMNQLKNDLAKEMGLWHLVQTEGWGALTAKDCGRIGGKMATKLSPNILRKIAQKAECRVSKERDL